MKLFKIHSKFRLSWYVRTEIFFFFIIRLGLYPNLRYWYLRILGIYLKYQYLRFGYNTWLKSNNEQTRSDLRQIPSCEAKTS